MRSVIRTSCVAFFLILTLSAHPTLATAIHTPADQPTFVTVLYEDPAVHHLGQYVIDYWEVPSPEGIIYEATFSLPSPSNIILALDVFYVNYDNPIKINGAQVGFLCGRGGGEEWYPEPCIYNIDSSFTVAGENILTIEMWYGGHQYDDIMFRNLMLYLCPGSVGFLDDDGDGWASCDGYFDCDDTDPSINPYSQELCDEIDWDCSGDPHDRDMDGDGHMDDDPGCLGDDCDDSNPDTYSGAPELCNGTDEDCDGIVPADEMDGDGDAWMICEGDCDDTDPEVNPDTVEGAQDEPTCSDGKDNDCDGLIDTDPDCMPIYVPADYATIQGALDAAGNGALVLVAPGTYVENIDFFGKAINVRSEAGAETTVIDGNEAGSVVSFASEETEESVLEGFTLRNGNSYDGGGIFCGYNTSPKIANCTILGNRVDHNGGGIACASSATIINCVISENYARYSGGGIGCWERSTPSIINCLIFRNTTDNKGGGIYNDEDSSATITNCTISANTAEYGAGIYSHGDSGQTITNCIVWRNYREEIWVGKSWRGSVTYSDIKWGFGGEGNIDVDPLFARDWDYHLSLSSPCVDSGTDAGVYEDIEGRDRPQIAEFDMGAYEYPDCVDDDGDGYGDHACGGYDCDDTAHEVNPGTDETCDNGIDDDCDGLVDSDDPNCMEVLVPSEYPTIQAGIDAVENGASILVAPGTYLENIAFLEKEITIKSADGPGVTTIDGNQAGRVVTFRRNEGAILDGFTITNGDGGISCHDYSTPIINNCVIMDNHGREGGGLYSFLSFPTITNCTIIGNTAEHYDGGGIYCRDSAPTISNCVIYGNRARELGGGIRLEDCEGTSYWPITKVTNCIISGNIAAEDDGGGVYVQWWSNCEIEFENCTISDNYAEDSGGGIYLDSSGTITNCTIEGNISDGWGGGVFAASSKEQYIKIENSILWDNFAPNSPVIYAGGYWGIVEVSYSDIQGGWSGEGNIDADPLFVDESLLLDVRARK